MDLSLISVSVILFLIMDPLGNSASFLHMVQGISPKRITWIVFREMAIVLGLMLFFNFLGEGILNLLEVSDISVRLASSVILFLAAIKVLFPAIDSLRANLPVGEPFVTPLAVPLIAGPSLLATIMLFAHLEPSVTLMLEAIFFSWLAAMLVLMAAPWLKKTIGDNGLKAGERLMGMLLVMLAIQRFMEGIHQFIHLHCLTGS